jgi:hypothetical protein
MHATGDLTSDDANRTIFLNHKIVPETDIAKRVLMYLQIHFSLPCIFIIFAAIITF